MKKSFLTLLLMLPLIIGGATTMQAAEDQPANGNVVTGFYHVPDSSSSGAAADSTVSEATESITKRDQPTYDTSKQTSNGAYSQYIPAAGDTTYYLQMMIGMTIIGFTMYLVKKKQKMRKKEQS